jgi:hypothetical protein
MQAAWPARASAPVQLRAAATLRHCAAGSPARWLAAQRLPLTRPEARRGGTDRVGGAASRSEAARVRAVGSDRLGAAGSGADGAPRRRRGQPRADAAGEAAQAEPQKRRQRARHSGEHGEKTADGKPKPDERTVADLAERGWFESEDVVVTLLTRMKSRKERFPYETAKPAADWLEAALGHEPVKNGMLPAAKVVNRFPYLLCLDAAALQRKWDALTLPAEQGGVGIAFSEEQAREAFLKYPPILGYATDTLKRGWLMLTAMEGGLGLSPDEARSCILRSPNVLMYNHDAVVQRVELLMSLGYPKAHKMVLDQSRVLNYKEETVKESVAWWKQTGLDHVKIVGTYSTLLGGTPVEDLQAKLDFLRLTGMSTAELNNAGLLFTLSLFGRLRARYFYTLREGNLARFTSMNTMMKETDATFLAMLQNQPYGTRASELEVARYQKLVKSAEFVAWREEQEAQRVLAAPQAAAHQPRR